MLKYILFAVLLFSAGPGFAQDSLDVAYVKTNTGQWQLIDRKGSVLADSLFEHESSVLLSCAEGWVIKEQHGKYGFIDLQHGNHIPCNYDSVSEFKQGYALVRMNGQWQRLSRKGILDSRKPDPTTVDHYLQSSEAEITCKDHYCLTDVDSFINCKGPDGKLLLTQSTVFIAPWNDVDAFINDRILKYKIMANKICSCDKLTSYYGFVDRNDRWVIAPDFEQADIFSFGMAAVSVGAEGIFTYGYIDMSGEWLINPVYKEAGRFMRIAVSR